MPRRCPECARHTKTETSRALREGRCWRRMAARPARATRRAAPAASGPPAGRGSGGRHVRGPLVWTCSSGRIAGVTCPYDYALTCILLTAAANRQFSPVARIGARRTPIPRGLCLECTACVLGPEHPVLRTSSCNVGGRERPLLGRSRSPGPLVTRSSRRREVCGSHDRQPAVPACGRPPRDPQYRPAVPPCLGQPSKARDPYRTATARRNADACPGRYQRP
jgi:hypothetical protein